MTRLISAVAVGAAVMAAVGCSSGQPLASQIAPGSMTVPCSQISSQIQTILPYYKNTAVTGNNLYGLETGLADIFANVSDFDSPVSLAKAEVAFESDVLDGGYITLNEPYSSVVGNDIDALASACGISTGTS